MRKVLERDPRFTGKFGQIVRTQVSMLFSGAAVSGSVVLRRKKGHPRDLFAGISIRAVAYIISVCSSR